MIEETQNPGDLNNFTQEWFNPEQLLKAVQQKKLEKSHELGMDTRENSVLYVAPRTPTEEKLASIWAELLGYEHVGINDDLFEYGGNSLSLTQLLARVFDTFLVEIPMRVFFMGTSNQITIADLARLVEEAQLDQVDQDDISSALKMLEGMSDEEIENYLQQNDSEK